MMNDRIVPGGTGRENAELDCRGAMERLFDLLDGELTVERERKVRSHITSCPGCFAHADFEERFLKAIRTARVSGNASLALRERVLSALRADGWQG
jgi:anti-sigma factor (TIGR02949 family)